MFTGIVEALGTLEAVKQEGKNQRLSIRAPFAQELRVDQSISVNGVCLTVEETGTDSFSVSVIEESLSKSELGSLDQGEPVNLERSMPANGRFDGHIVQGHVDATALCVRKAERDGSWDYGFQLDQTHGGLLVPKGSITLDGVSLTVIEPEEQSFGVAIIPYTHQNTRFGALEKGDRVNVEFDVLGKYVKAQIKE